MSGSQQSSTMTLPKRTLVLGGVSSGKSSFAEDLAIRSKQPLVYIATCQIRDAEMRAKADTHALRRGDAWDVFETGPEIAEVLAALDPGAVVLLDCATMWLMGHFEAGGDEGTATKAFLSALAACRADMIIVSNEIGLGGVAGDSLTRRFAQAQGTLNQALAAECSVVVTVMAGLPLVLKGNLP